MRHNNCNVKQTLNNDTNENENNSIEKKLVQSRLNFKPTPNKRKLCKGDESDNTEKEDGSNSNSNTESNECKENASAPIIEVNNCSSPEPRPVENEINCKPKVIIKLPGLRKSKIIDATKESENNADKADRLHPNKRMKLETANSSEKVVSMDTIELNSDSSNEARDCKVSELNESLDTASDSEQKFGDISSNSVKYTEMKAPPSPSSAKDKKTVKLSEKRRKARDKKEVKLQEDQKQETVEKEKRESIKKQERENRIEERKKEREEKEKQKRTEREEKDKKRLAELNAKTEEKRKRTEAREEELRKKEEERRRKDQEKEEAAVKKKKAAEGFKKFFVAKELNTSPEVENVFKQNSEIGTQHLAFRPFQIKGDMKLAPVCRKRISTESKLDLDTILKSAEYTDADIKRQTKNLATKTTLYLSQLNIGSIVPMKWRKTSKEFEEDDDICIVDDLERAGQAIEENHSTVERHRTKFFKFHENRRPPYFGTWRKKTSVIQPTRPFAKDEKFFDYDVDSDLDWEEEEPGESLDGSDDEKEKESEDEDYEVDNKWFVPHGHLSDEELQNEFENGLNNNNDREAQKVKLKIKQQEFAMQMNKKTEKLKPRLLGCIWVDENGNQPKDFSNLIWNTLNKRSMIFTTISMDEAEETVNQEIASPIINTTEKLKPIVLNDKLLKDLIRLIHGNSNSKSFLIKEYITFIETNENSVKNGGARGPLKSVVREKIDEFAEWKVIEAASTDISKRTNKVKKRLCWIVADHILRHMEMEELTLHNNWQYILQPKLHTVIRSKDSV